MKEKKNYQVDNKYQQNFYVVSTQVGIYLIKH